LIGLRQGGLNHHRLAEILDREQADKTAVSLPNTLSEVRVSIPTA
jgi:hypothetical protein